MRLWSGALVDNKSQDKKFAWSQSEVLKNECPHICFLHRFDFAVLCMYSFIVIQAPIKGASSYTRIRSMPVGSFVVSMQVDWLNRKLIYLDQTWVWITVRPCGMILDADWLALAVQGCKHWQVTGWQLESISSSIISSDLRCLSEAWIQSSWVNQWEKKC